MDIRDVDRILATKKWPEISPWWWHVIDEVEASGVRNVVVRGGRRGGKSSTLVKIATAAVRRTKKNEIGEDVPYYYVPPGDVGYFAIISADKDQAKKRLDSCSLALHAMGINHRKTAEEITFDDVNLGIKCFAASMSAVVSFTCIGALCDEVTRWKDKDTGANPAREIIASLRPTSATIKNAVLWFVSSPFSTLDIHYEMFEQGDSEAQRVFYAPTWVMNPTLTERDTRLLEPDERTWEREYKGIPMASDETRFFSAEFIDAATKIVLGGDPIRTTSGGDFAFRRDAAAMVALGDYGKAFGVRATEERIPGARALKPSATITDLAHHAIAAGADSIACDLHYIETVREHVEDLPIELLEYPTNEKEKYYVKLRVLLGDSKVSLAGVPAKFIQQLKAVTCKPLENGTLKIEVKRKEGLSHGDMVDGLVCALWAHSQPVPERKMLVGERRFAADRHAKVKNPNSTMTEYADND